MSAVSANSIRWEKGAAGPGGCPLDKVRALQRTLYRCAKQEPERRFHALYSYVHRMDVPRRAWVGVCANRGAPGVDGVTVDSVAASGVDCSSRNCRRNCGRIRIVRRYCGGSRFPTGAAGRVQAAFDSHRGGPCGDDGRETGP